MRRPATGSQFELHRTAMADNRHPPVGAVHRDAIDLPEQAFLVDRAAQEALPGEPGVRPAGEALDSGGVGLLIHGVSADDRTGEPRFRGVQRRRESAQRHDGGHDRTFVVEAAAPIDDRQALFLSKLPNPGHPVPNCCFVASAIHLDRDPAVAEVLHETFGARERLSIVPEPGVAFGDGVGVRFEHHGTLARPLDNLDHVLAPRTDDLSLDARAVLAGRFEDPACNGRRIVAPPFFARIAGSLHQVL